MHEDFNENYWLRVEVLYRGRIFKYHSFRKAVLSAIHGLILLYILRNMGSWVDLEVKTMMVG